MRIEIASASWFVAKADRSGHRITPLSLQKLLYFAHGYRLTRSSQPLLDSVEAWENGPVCPTIYRTYKEHGSEPIAPSVSLAEAEAGLSRSLIYVLEDVWHDYGEYTAHQLWVATHASRTPYDLVYRDGVRNIPISDSLIQDFFSADARAVRGSDSKAPTLADRLKYLEKYRPKIDVRNFRGDKGAKAELDPWLDSISHVTREHLD